VARVSIFNPCVKIPIIKAALSASARSFYLISSALPNTIQLFCNSRLKRLFHPFQSRPQIRMSSTHTVVEDCVDITRENFKRMLPLVQKRLQECTFYALDCEMTGMAGSRGRPDYPLLIDSIRLSPRIAASHVIRSLCRWGEGGFSGRLFR